MTREIIADLTASHLAFQGLTASDADTREQVAATVRKVLRSQTVGARWRYVGRGERDPGFEVVVLTERKADDSGWWVSTLDGQPAGGLADRVIASGTWVPDGEVTHSDGGGA